MVSFLLLESVSEYKTAVMKRDFEVADCMLQNCRTAVGSENNHRSFSQDTRIKAAGFDNQHR